MSGTVYGDCEEICVDEDVAHKCDAHLATNNAEALLNKAEALLKVRLVRA